jgi:hypothetical protein
MKQEIISQIKKELVKFRDELLEAHTGKHTTGEVSKWGEIKRLQKKIERNLKTLELIKLVDRVIA